MCQATRRLTFFLILIVATSSLIIAETAEAQTTRPFVPEFTLQYVEVSIDVPPVTTTDPYTGKSIDISPHYQGQTRNVDVTVNNQPYGPFTDANGNYLSLYYQVELKGHYNDVWNSYPPAGCDNKFFAASTSDRTVIRVSLEYYPEIPSGGQLDFRVEAVLAAQGSSGLSVESESGWSEAQTITVAGNTVTASPTAMPTQPPTPTSTSTAEIVTPVQEINSQPNFVGGLSFGEAMIVGLCVLFVVLALVLAWRSRK
jgi:hypothetical protein